MGANQHMILIISYPELNSGLPGTLAWNPGLEPGIEWFKTTQYRDYRE